MDGAYLIDKPAGPTSHDLVYEVRRKVNAEIDRTRQIKVGHAGTLDPFASGLMIVLVGRATRAQRFVMGLPKSYEAVARLGWTSTTGDPEGDLTETGNVPPDPPELPTGRLSQRPPAYSAIKIDGKRAYARARAGEEVQTPEREVTVTRFAQLRRAGDLATFAIDCSSGTYVRSLIAGLADAYCVELRRTAIGPFAVGDADPERLLSLETLLGAVMETRTVAEPEAQRIAHGRPIEGSAPDYILLVDEGGAVAIATEREAGILRPVVGFRG